MDILSESNVFSPRGVKWTVIKTNIYRYMRWCKTHIWKTSYILKNSAVSITQRFHEYKLGAYYSFWVLIIIIPLVKKLFTDTWNSSYVNSGEDEMQHWEQVSSIYSQKINISTSEHWKFTQVLECLQPSIQQILRPILIRLCSKPKYINLSSR